MARETPRERDKRLARNAAARARRARRSAQERGLLMPNGEILATEPFRPDELRELTPPQPIRLAQVETIDDALAWLSAQTAVSAIHLHVLQKQFLDDPRFGELDELVQRMGIPITGEPAL